MVPSGSLLADAGVQWSYPEGVAVWKSTARLFSAGGALAGEGRAYVHLRRAAVEPQPVQGTLSLDWWDEADAPLRLELENGPTLDLRVTQDRLSGCMVGRIVRYEADWPGAAEPTS